jgi:NAD+-dependent protein deacetylase SIR2
LFDVSVYNNPDDTEAHHDMVRELYEKTQQAKPTLFHHLVAALAAENRLLRLYSQNVDGLENQLKSLETQHPLPTKAPWPKTIQLHGGLQNMQCCKCHTTRPFQPELFKGPIAPTCPECEETEKARDVTGKRCLGVGRLRPRMVLYNEHTNFDENAIGAVSHSDLRAKPDAVIVVGTTVKVPGTRRIVREMCKSVKDRKNGLSIWINPDPEPSGKDMEGLWDLVVRGTCDEVARLAALTKWNEVEGQAVSSEYVEMKKMAEEVTVVIQTTPRKPQSSEQTLTPGATPKLSPQPDTKLAEQAASPSKKPKADAAGKASKIPTLNGKTGKAGTKKAAGPKKPRAPAKKKSAQAAQASNTKINFTQSKPNAGLVGKIKHEGTPLTLHQNKHMLPKLQASPASSELSAVSACSTPMAPSSPNAAKNNWAIPTSRFPNLLKRETLDQMRETISPPSSPKGLQGMID